MSYILSFSTLRDKGSSAWELYGEEGKNGVVIVELKKEAKFNFE
ncbi:hypothetical protein [Mongoliitalea daihaiensis]|nr:hypothetical protein [Mongoliitalea daihaiensis]